MSTIRPRRSVLYMPGSNARALEKARTLVADALILDLEDAVAPDMKETARRQVADAVTAGGFGPREVIIRVNALSSPWGEADLAAAGAARPDAILLPKVESAADIITAGRKLDAAGVPDTVAIWVMIETPRAILAADAIGAAKCDPAGRRLAVYVMGTNDLAKETRARLVPGRAPMLAWLSQAVLAARANALEIVDGVYTALKDMDGFRQECAEGRDMGMDGKTVIHPDQIAVANEVFAPSAAEVEVARKIIAAFAAPDAAGKGALQVDGRMVERLHAEMAERTVAIADAIAARA
jgi:citrate lyase subunit beta/citryl-CoA lyase